MIFLYRKNAEGDDKFKEFKHYTNSPPRLGLLELSTKRCLASRKGISLPPFATVDYRQLRWQVKVYLFQ